MKKQLRASLCLFVIVSLFSTSLSAASSVAAGGKDLSGKVSNAKSVPDYAEDLLEKAESSELTLAESEFQKEIEKTAAAITKLNRSPILVGDNDKAKQIVINGLARYLASDDDVANGRSLWRLNLGVLQENESKQATQKLKNLLTAAEKQKAVLVVDNLLPHLSGKDDIAAVLTAAVETNKIRFISTSDAASHREFFAHHAKLKSLFQPIAVVEKVAATESTEEDFVGDKISPDLRELMATAAPDAKAKIILQASDINNGELRELLQTNGVEIKNEIERFKTLVIELPVRVVEQIAANNTARHLSLDRPVKLTGHIENTVGVTAMRSLAGNSTLDGRGIGIAVLDSSIYNSHHSFLGSDGNTRITAQVDFTGEGMDTDDPYGHGTHVAALAAGSRGKDDSDLTQYKGVAPAAKIINVRVLGENGTGSVSRLLQALDWIQNNRTQYNIRVVNMSLGTRAVESYRNDPLCRATRRLVDAGIVVVAAAGNDGKDSLGNKLYGTIHAPANDPSVITVGASNSYGTDARADDTIATFSSRGPTRSFYTEANGVKRYDNLIKPDLVAPGNKLVAASAKHNLLLEQNPQLEARDNGNDDTRLMYLSGTSMAAPIVAGTAALMLQANPKLTPNMVKMILQYTAQPLANFNYFEQGAGLVNVEGAVRLARLVRQDLNNSTPLNAQMLTTTTLPTHVSNVGGTRFMWAGGILCDHFTLTGTNLIGKYQDIYDLASRYGAGILIGGGGNLQINGILIGGGIGIGDSIVSSSGAVLDANANPVGYQTINNGTQVHPASILFSSNAVNDGTLFGDGILIGGGGILPSGILIGGGGATVQAFRVTLNGDNTAAMH